MSESTTLLKKSKKMWIRSQSTNLETVADQSPQVRAPPICTALATMVRFILRDVPRSALKTET